MSIRSLRLRLFRTSIRPSLQTNLNLQQLLYSPTTKPISKLHTSPTMSSTTQQRADAEKLINRNPHRDFKSVEASRSPWDHSKSWTVTQTVSPSWKLGSGANDQSSSLQIPHIEIDPYEEGRPAVYNYKLLISSIIPRPIGFVRYAGGLDNAKDSLRNLKETGECTINIISEHFLEAANATSINAPYGESEWAFSGLTPAPCTTVKTSRVQEAHFSVEGKLESLKEFESRATPGKKTGVLAVIEGTRFWVRENAINEEKNIVDPAVLKPISRLGGITYGRTTEGIEIPRPDYETVVERDEEAKKLVKAKLDDQ